MTTMQKHKTSFLVLILIFTLAGSAFGSFDVKSGVSGHAGGAFCYPTADYLKTYPGDSSASVTLPTFRTSGSFGLDVELLQVHFGAQNWSIFCGFGFSYVGVTQSLAYGVSVLRPYNGQGLFLDLGAAFNDFFSLEILYRVLHCNFPSVKQVFLAYDVEAIPTFKFASLGAFGFSVVAPLTVSIKKDAVTLRFSLGLRLDCSFGTLFNKKEAPNEV